MKLTKEQVKHVGKLANLPLTEQEEDRYAEQLSKILDYIDQLNTVNTDGVGPTYNVSGLVNVMAKDEVGDCTLPQEGALANATGKRDGYFVTKGVFDND